MRFSRQSLAGLFVALSTLGCDGEKAEKAIDKQPPLLAGHCMSRDGQRCVDSSNQAVTVTECESGTYQPFALGPCPLENQIGVCVADDGQALQQLYPPTDGADWCSSIDPGFSFRPI